MMNHKRYISVVLFGFYLSLVYGHRQIHIDSEVLIIGWLKVPWIFTQVNLILLMRIWKKHKRAIGNLEM